jgi:hypothetical protein
MCYDYQEVINLLNMIKGCRIHDPSMLFEGYEQTEFGFVANVNADKIKSLLESFVLLHNEPCFVIIEVPTNGNVEATLTTDSIHTLHKDIYYLDGLSPERAIEFLHVFGEWLIHDGLSSFGFGLHSGGNEIVSGKYNVITVYTKTPQMYRNYFQLHNIDRVPNLKTAWDFFTQDHPGDSFLYEHKGNDIYDIVEHLKQYGLYFAERREE